MSKKAKEVDGLTLVRALQEARAAAHRPPLPLAKPPVSPEKGTEAHPSNVRETTPRIGRTAAPSRQDIFCYECGYAFTVTGRPPTIICPKCRHTLDQADYTLEGEYSASVKTTGAIRLAPGALLRGGTLIARDISLAGAMDGGTVRALRRLVLETGAVFDIERISAPELVVRAGVVVRFAGTRAFRLLEIEGEVKGDLEVSGLLVVKSGGHFLGRARADRMIVEEGAGLSAELAVFPGAAGAPSHRHIGR